MCSIRCRDSKSTVCKCECNGLFHGTLNRTMEQQLAYLNTTFPPCTPVRFDKPTKRGTLEGRILSFHESNRYFHARALLAGGEVVSIDQISTIGEKHENHNKNQKRSADGRRMGSSRTASKKAPTISPIS